MAAPCSDAGCRAPACVVCCGAPLCLLHATATRHAQHPSLWRVTDAAEHARTLPAVQLRRERAAGLLEAELERLLRGDASSADAVAAAAAAGDGDRLRKVTPAGAPEQLPVLPRPQLLAAEADVLALIEEGELEEQQQQQQQQEWRQRRRRRREAADEYDDSDEDEDGEDDATARSRAGAARASTWSHNLRPQRRDSAFAAAASPAAAGSVGCGGCLLVEHRAVAVAAAAEDGLSAAGLRGSVRSQVGNAVRDGARLDVLAAVAAPVPAQAPPSLSTTLRVQQDQQALASRSAQERLEALVPKPAALAALARDVESALLAATADDLPATVPALGSDASSPPAPSPALEPGDSYRRRARALVAALRHAGNTALRARVLAGELAPAQLVALSAAELAAPTMRAADALLSSEAVRMAAVEDDGHGRWGATSGEALRCNNCGARSGLESRPIAEARDIRKAEIWGTSAIGDEVVFALRCSGCMMTWLGPEG